jgi:hypothetical protein
MVASMIQYQVREGKSLQINERVEVYYNLHKGGFSIKALQGEHKGTVVAYSGIVNLSDCEYRVNENALNTILATKRKKVYAVVRGAFKGANKQDTASLEKLSINPYANPFFTDTKGQRVHESKQAYFTGKGVWK